MRRLPAALVAAGAVLLVAAPGASQPGGPPPTAGSGQSALAPQIAAIVDVPPGGGGQPIKAIWRDPVTLTRYHLALDPAIDARTWQIDHTTDAWAPKDVRIALGFGDGGVPTARLAGLDDDAALGTAAAVLESDGLTVDVPGIPGAGANLRTVARTGEGATAGTVVLGPIRVEELSSAPSEGLRSPTDAVLYGTDGLPTEQATSAPAGPAVRRTGAGIRITLPEPIPTTANGLAVTAVTDRFLVRASDDLFAPIVASLVVTADGVTALDAVGTQLPSADAPWSVPFEAADGATPFLDVSFAELGNLLGTPLGGAARIGVLRVLDLDDGTRLIADGLDLRVDALPQSIAADEEEAAPRRRVDDDSPAAWRTILPVAIGLALVAAVLAPGVWFRIQDRRARRARDH